MKPICVESCRVSGPHGLTSCLPARTRTCGGTRLYHGACSIAFGSKPLLSCCSSSSSSSHQLTGMPSCSRVSTAASHQRSVDCSISTSGQQQQPLPSRTAASTAQQQHVAEATARATAAAAQRAMPFAALSRVLLTSSNANVFKSLAQRRQPVSGPMGVLLFLATLIAASFAAIRSALMRRGKSCKTCRGFGLQRCRLCLGSGRVDWAAKLKHFDVCPLCMNRRFIVCGECGGHYHRAMFAHRRRQAGGAFEPDNSVSGGSSTSAGGFGNDSGNLQGPIVLNMAAAGAAAGGVTVVTSGINMTSGSLNPVLSSMSD